jgi:hypothetical protein
LTNVTQIRPRRGLSSEARLPKDLGAALIVLSNAKQYETQGLSQEAAIERAWSEILEDERRKMARVKGQLAVHALSLPVFVGMAALWYLVLGPYVLGTGSPGSAFWWLGVGALFLSVFGNFIALVEYRAERKLVGRFDADLSTN